MIHELRIYHAMPGRLPDIQRRFADVTMRLFARHGIKVIGFWDTIVGSSDELIYICEFESVEHQQRAWQSFQSDPEWQQAKAASEANGPLVARVENKLLRPTAYSPHR